MEVMMNKSLLTGLTIGAVVATAGGVVATNYSTWVKQPEEPTFAQVLHVKELKRAVQTPREVCEDVPVTRQKPVKDQNKVVGTVTGALLGGVLGHQVGEGSGKQLATVAGAVAGGYAGNKVQENMQTNDTYTTTDQRCHTVTDSRQVVDGYEVTYQLGETEGKVRMDHQPEDIIPVVNGQLVLDESSQAINK
jgi:uncharacterized protein YcfJ